MLIWLGDIRVSNRVPGDHLEEWGLLALLKVLGLGDKEVWLALAGSLSLRLGLNVEVLDLQLLHAPSFFQLVDLELWQLVDGVLSQALTLDRLFHGGEERDLLRNIAFLIEWQLNVVGFDLGAAGSSNIHLDLGEDGLLDVGDRGWLHLGNQEGLNNTRLNVNQDWLQQVALEFLWDGLDLDDLGRFLFPQDATSLFREPDILTVDGEELWFSNPEAHGVVRVGLEVDLGSHLDTRPVGLADLWDAVEDLGLVVEDKLLTRGPAIVVEGVGVHRGNN